MFETSSILSMLGMGVQLKSAGQTSMALPAAAPAMQAGSGGEANIAQQQVLDQNGSMFRLMLSYALPQAGSTAAQALPAAPVVPAAEAGDAVSTSIALPFKNEKSEQHTDEQDVTASMMMPFYPVHWDAAALALQMNQAGIQPGAVSATTETGAQGVAQAAGDEAGKQNVLSTLELLKQQPVLGQDGRGNAAVVDLLKQNQSAVQNDRVNAAVVEMMKQNQPAVQDEQMNAAVAEMMKRQPGVQTQTSAPVQQNPAADAVRADAKSVQAVVEAAPETTSPVVVGTLAEAALESALGGKRLQKTISLQTDSQTAAHAPEQGSMPVAAQPAQTHQAASSTAVTAATNEKILSIDEALAAALQTKLADAADGAKGAAALVPVTIAADQARQLQHEETSTHITPSQSSSREAVAQNNSVTAKNNDVTIPVTVSQRGVREQQMLVEQQAVAAEDTVVTVQPKEATTRPATAAPVVASTIQQQAAEVTPIAPVEHVETDTAAPVETRKFNAAHAWAESVVRKIAAAQTAVTSAARMEKASETVAAATAPEPIGVRVHNEKTILQQPAQTVVETAAIPAQELKDASDLSIAQVRGKIISAPETHTALHEVAARAADADAVRSAVKTPAGVQVSLRAAAEDGDTSAALKVGEKITPVPAADAAVQASAAPVKTRDDVPVQAKAEPVQEIRAAKIDVPTQQPLVNVADVQRQIVPLRETTPVITPRVREEVIEKVFKEVSAIKHTPTSVDVTLTPGSLGTVTVKVGLEEGKMAARIDVQNADVKHIIESNMPKLQEALQSNGLAVDTIGVFVNTGSAFAEKRQEAARKRAGGNALKIDDRFEPLNTQRDSKQYGYNTVEYIM